MGDDVFGCLLQHRAHRFWGQFERKWRTWQRTRFFSTHEVFLLDDGGFELGAKENQKSRRVSSRRDSVFWNAHVERRTFAGHRIDGNFAPVTFNDTSRNGEPEPRASFAIGGLHAGR